MIWHSTIHGREKSMLPCSATGGPFATLGCCSELEDRNDRFLSDNCRSLPLHISPLHRTGAAAIRIHTYAFVRRRMGKGGPGPC